MAAAGDDQTRRKPVNVPRPQKALTLALCCAAQFMVILDVAIVNVALPAIQVDLGMGESALQWIVIAYGLLLGGFLLLGGRLGDLLGRRRVLLAGLAIFSGASLVAGLSGSAGLLIAARAVQGFGAALVAPSALSILAVTFAEGRERNWALGIFGAIAGTSASVGVLASGLLTDGPGWSWIFFINVPIGAALILLAASILPAARPGVGSRRFDAVGASTVTAGLLLFVYALNRGADHGWASAGTLALFAGAVALLATFAVVESRSRSALVPANVLRNRTMVAADVASFLATAAFFSFVFLGSLLMQQVLRYSPTHTGVAWLATSVTAFFAAGLVGARLASLVGVKRLVIGGMSLLALGMAWLTRVPAGAEYLTDLMPAFLLAGIAIGMSAPSVQIGALSGVRGASAGLASGLVETMRQVGGAVGIAVVTTVLVTRTKDAGAALQGFRSAFTVIVAIAALGAVVAAIAFPGPAPLVRTRPEGDHTEAAVGTVSPGDR
jgi:EmrB/QacA subfamily drug resistance transporter